MKKKLELFLQAIERLYLINSVKIISVFTLFFLVFSLIYLTIDQFTSLDDQFFNIKLAQIIKENGIGVLNNFHWLYFSEMAQGGQPFFSNPLFYIVLLPFTFIAPLFLGIKLYSITFAAILFSIFYAFLLKIKEKNAFIWTIVFFSIIGHTFIWKMLMARAFVVAPAILLLLLYFTYRKKYTWIFTISMLYFFWHTATFFFPLLVVGAYFLFENFYGKKLNWKLIGSSLGGTCMAALLVYIFFPNALANFFDAFKAIFGIFRDTIIGKSVKIEEGAELYGVNVFDVVKASFLLIAMFIIAVFFEIINYIESKKKNGVVLIEKVDKKILRSTLFFLSLVFFLGMFVTARNTDFFNFFVVVYVSLSFNIFLSHIKSNFVLIQKAFFYGFSIAIFYLFIANGLLVHDLIATSAPYNRIEGAAKWLENNTNEGEVVFNVTWNWFPTLFYYNSHNNYVIGAEPRNLYDFNPALYWSWWHISNDGFLCEQQECSDIEIEKKTALMNDENRKAWYNTKGDMVAEYIVKNFKSHYVISAINFKNMNDLMDNNDGFEKVYTDNIYNKFFVYKINL